ncbi:MAG: hypothetical protein ACI8W7_000272 [Gammaproteobacteria bacterium]|jgi:hypothetical protein
MTRSAGGQEGANCKTRERRTSRADAIAGQVRKAADGPLLARPQTVHCAFFQLRRLAPTLGSRVQVRRCINPNRDVSRRVKLVLYECPSAFLPAAPSTGLRLGSQHA